MPKKLRLSRGIIGLNVFAGCAGQQASAAGHWAEDLPMGSYSGTPPEGGRINPLHCGHCKKRCGPSDDDPCIEGLPNVTSACCGHGGVNEPYIQYAPGVLIKGEAAFRVQRDIVAMVDRIAELELENEKLRKVVIQTSGVMDSVEAKLAELEKGITETLEAALPPEDSA